MIALLFDAQCIKVVIRGEIISQEELALKAREARETSESTEKIVRMNFVNVHLFSPSASFSNSGISLFAWL